MVMIKKKDGAWRIFSIDFRKVNSVTHKDAYTLPRIDETLESLSGSQYFTILDLASGYWQVEVEHLWNHWTWKERFMTNDFPNSYWGKLKFKGLCVLSPSALAKESPAAGLISVYYS